MVQSPLDRGDSKSVSFSNVHSGLKEATAIRNRQHRVRRRSEKGFGSVPTTFAQE